MDSWQQFVSKALSNKDLREVVKRGFREYQELAFKELLKCASPYDFADIILYCAYKKYKHLAWIELNKLPISETKDILHEIIIGKSTGVGHWSSYPEKYRKLACATLEKYSMWGLYEVFKKLKGMDNLYYSIKAKLRRDLGPSKEILLERMLK